MCEFCHQHGEGKRWYLQAENYAEDLLSDLNRRKYIHHFFENPDRLGRNIGLLDDLNRLPSFVQTVVKPFLINRQKKKHYGQVLPIEEIEKIFSFINSVVRLPCICRKVSMGSEQRYCYGLSMEPGQETEMGKLIRSIGADYLTGPETSGLETLSKEEALDQFRELEHKDLIHSVWTFVTPFIGGICNCDMNCMAMKATSKAYPVMFKAEFLAMIDMESCSGCQACIRSCHFGAISYKLNDEKAYIDPLKCFGCGICRVSCRQEAISLVERSAVVEASNLW
ncbi:MAG: 4Fe-4S binding protein [Bacillota bacterium]|nr:4Fe-4S binding protein [Bacillota bacterium]